MRDEIVAAVKAAGVVGAGGAGFPTHIKINATVDTVIANGAECEPLLRAHQHIMATESTKMVLGLKTVMLATGAQRGYIGLKRKYTEAVTNLLVAIESIGGDDVELFFLPDIYPAGDEHVLVHEVTGRIVPEGGIPLHVGIVVANVETLVNIANALQGIPVTDKYVTISGAVRTPVTLKVPIGMKVEDLITLAGGPLIRPYAVIDGGPMMGKLTEADAPVTKTTGGILVLPMDHSLVTQRNTTWQMIVNRARAVCCNCLACTEACPRNLLGHRLEPHRIMQAIGRGQVNDSEILSHALLCSECGACDTFGCTMGLSPRRVNGELKKQLAKAGIKNTHHNKPDKVRLNREYHLIPTKRLTARLGLTHYDVKAPLNMEEIVAREVRLPLSQHLGAPAQAIVKVGDYVKKGDLIGKIADGAALSANLHASISGEVFAVDQSISIRMV